MKIKWNSKYTSISIYAFLVACASIIFFLIASEMKKFQMQISGLTATFMPIIIGFVMAYLFNFLLNFFEKSILNIKILNKRKPKRFIGLILTYITVGLILFLFINFIVPQLVSSIMGLVDDVPTYITNITKMVNDFDSKYEIQEEYYNLIIDQWDKYKDSIIKFVTDLIP